MNEFYVDQDTPGQEEAPAQNNSEEVFVYTPIINQKHADSILLSTQYNLDDGLVIGQTMGITITEPSPGLIIPIVSVTKIQAEAFTRQILTVVKRYMRTNGARAAQILPPLAMSLKVTQKEAMSELRRHYRVAEKAGGLVSPVMLSSMSKVNDEVGIVVSGNFKTDTVNSFMDANDTKTVHLNAVVSCVWESNALNLYVKLDTFNCQEDAVLATMIPPLLRENYESLFKLALPAKVRKEIDNNLPTRTFLMSSDPIDMKHVQHTINETCGTSGIHYATTIPEADGNDSILTQIRLAMENNHNGITQGCTALATGDLNLVNPLSLLWVDTPVLHTELRSGYRTANDRTIGFDTWDFTAGQQGGVAAYSVSAPYGYSTPK